MKWKCSLVFVFATCSVQARTTLAIDPDEQRAIVKILSSANDFDPAPERLYQGLRVRPEVRNGSERKQVRATTSQILFDCTRVQMISLTTCIIEVPAGSGIKIDAEEGLVDALLEGKDALELSYFFHLDDQGHFLFEDTDLQVGLSSTKTRFRLKAHAGPE